MNFFFKSCSVKIISKKLISPEITEKRVERNDATRVLINQSVKKENQ